MDDIIIIIIIVLLLSHTHASHDNIVFTPYEQEFKDNKFMFSFVTGL